MTNLDNFISGYIQAALWTTDDDDGNTLSHPGIKDIEPVTLFQLTTDAAQFFHDNVVMLEAAIAASPPEDKYNFEKAGHDFWLTRNRYGDGFLFNTLCGLEKYLDMKALQYPGQTLCLSNGMVCLR